jgi:hypothetical protein
LVAEIRPRLSYFAILFLIPHQQIGYIFLKLAQLHRQTYMALCTSRESSCCRRSRAYPK